jgi:site-specific recombinase XerC
MHAALKAWLDLRDLARARRTTARGSRCTARRNARKPIRFRTFGLLLQPLGIEYHRLRHTYATFALQAGMPAEKLMKILGHSKLSQTLGYAKIGTEDVLEAAGAVESKLETRIGRAA